MDLNKAELTLLRDYLDEDIESLRWFMDDRPADPHNPKRMAAVKMRQIIRGKLTAEIERYNKN